MDVPPSSLLGERAVLTLPQITLKMNVARLPGKQVGIGRGDDTAPEPQVEIDRVL